MSEHDPIHIGQVIASQFNILRKLGAGGMDAVDQSPFSTISVMNGADNLTVVLSRNALAKSTGPKGVSGKSFFGVNAIDDATIMTRMDNVVVLRSRKPMAEVCAFYAARYGELEGVMSTQDVEAKQPYCNMAATATAKIDWQAIAIIDDPTSEGAVMISIMAKQ